jgi:hypothetical protein
MNKKSMSAQAVGGAVGYNPISIIIPCHYLHDPLETIAGSPVREAVAGCIGENKVVCIVPRIENFGLRFLNCRLTKLQYMFTMPV